MYVVFEREAREYLFSFNYSLVPLTQLITLTRISHSQEYDSNVTKYLSRASRSNTGTRALQTMSWSEACQRYFKVLEFGDEMNADLLAQVMGCDVKTGRKRGRTRCWTQAELLARKDSVSSTSSSRTSTPQSNRKKSKKFHAYKYVSLDEKNPNPNISREVIDRWGTTERLEYIAANIRACVRTNTNVSGGTKMFKSFHSAAVRYCQKYSNTNNEKTLKHQQVRAAQNHKKIQSSIVTGLENAIENFKSNACGASKRKLLVVLNDINVLISPDKKMSIPFDDSSSNTNTMKTPPKPKIKIRIQDLTKEKQEEIKSGKPRSTLNLTWDQPVENPEDLGFCPLCDNSSHKSTLISCSKPGCPGIFHVKCVKVKTKPFLCSWCSKKRNERKFAKLSVDRPSNLQLRKILDEIEMHDYASIFAEPVNLELNPSYVSSLLLR